ncbi:MAG: EsaB/YukD family protein, partial [Planctomycetota bacterium]
MSDTPTATPAPASSPASTQAASADAQVLVEIWDATGNKRQEAQLPADEPLERILAVLIDRMKFPRTGPDGNLLSYKVHHRRSGKQLAEDATLQGADVQPGDVLRLVPEIT